MSDSDLALVVRRNFEIDGERFALVVETQHGPIVAWTAIHRHSFSRRIGGVRFVEAGTLSELGHLSSAMSEKCLAARLPVDGQKSLILCPGGIPRSMADRARIVIAHARAVISVDQGVIFGPDMNCPEAVIDLVAAELDLADHVAGRSVDHGGLGIDVHGYTGYGLGHAVAAVAKATGGRFRHATIQGFGFVGCHAALELARQGISIRAVSTVRGALIARSGGLDVQALVRARETWGESFVSELPRARPDVQFTPDPDDLLDEPADVFVPAARTSVLVTAAELDVARRENPNVRDVALFADFTSPRLIAEGANHPLSNRARRLLEERGVLVLPDVLVNLGGLVGCYFEWAFREDLAASGVTTRVAAAARAFIRACIDANVSAIIASTDGCRQAVVRLADANRPEILARLRGLGTPTGRAGIRALLDSSDSVSGLA